MKMKYQPTDADEAQRLEEEFRQLRLKPNENPKFMMERLQ